MLGNTVKKVTWMARATTTIVGLAIMLALVFGVATTALAGTGIGATFNLGQINTVNAISKLVGSVAGPSLQIDNNSTDAAATALDLQVEAGKAPMKINSETQVANLIQRPQLGLPQVRESFLPGGEDDRGDRLRHQRRQERHLSEHSDRRRGRPDTALLHIRRRGSDGGGPDQPQLERGRRSDLRHRAVALSWRL
jgi:hypothetical protein